ncbi:MAG: hypothetical protein IJ530_13815 [Treponema sp.]|uniref:hypothetical protein n=1 Tax=Treponema sp. TaxID=166 RepID=UPI0025CD59D1|nr:hypothetical protein [Treponema sp.]MBQ8680807.1 hypothetical protein [Treponema sp.]
MKKIVYFCLFLFLYFLSACSKNSSDSAGSFDDLVSDFLTVSDYSKDISPDEFLLEMWGKGDSQGIKKAILKGANANSIYKGKSLLYYLASKNQTEVALLAIEHGANVNWVDTEEQLSVFSWAIHHNNLILGKAILEKSVDLNYRGYNGQTYLTCCTENQNDKNHGLYLNYDFAEMFLGYDYVRSYFKQESGTLYDLIYRWTEKTPKLIETIYGENYVFPDEIPVLLIAIDNKDALEYFIGKGVNPNKKYYDDEEELFFTPLEKALEVRDNLTHYHGNDKKFDEDSDDVKKIDLIIEYLNTFL